jgi:Nucleoside 2-deoxyribosyltransferase like
MKYIECPAEYLYAGSEPTLFLAGGITGAPDWQKEMVQRLAGSDLTLLNPRRAHWKTKPGIEEEQIEWEHRHLAGADAILFWFPAETICPIALYELGAWNSRPKKLFIGCDPAYQRRRDVEIQTRLERPSQVIAYSLDELAQQVLEWEGEDEGR